MLTRNVNTYLKINDGWQPVKDEPGLRAKMAAKEKKRQDLLRAKDEPGLKEKAAAKKTKSAREGGDKSV